MLQNLPKIYKTVITICEDEMSNGCLDLDTLKDRLRSKYNRVKKEKTESDDEVALMTGRRLKECAMCVEKCRGNRGFAADMSPTWYLSC